MRRVMQGRLNDLTTGVIPTIQTGTVVSMSPLTLNTFVSGAHGLLSVPSFSRVELVALATQGNWTSGTRIQLNGSPVERTAATAQGIIITADATSLRILYSIGLTIPTATGNSEITITASKWEVNVTPYYITT